MQVRDIKVDGGGTNEGILVDDVNNFECYRNIISNGTYLVKFSGEGTTGHKIHNCDFANFSIDGIFKDGGDIEFIYCSGLNKDDTDPNEVKAFIHGIDIALTVRQSAFAIYGENPEHYIYYIEETNPPFSTFTLDRNLYWTGCEKLGSVARLARRDIITVLADHERVTDIGGSTTFTDADALFTSLSLNEDDILSFETNPGNLQLVGTSASALNIGEYLIKTLNSDIQLVIDPNTTEELGDFEYSIRREDITTFNEDQVGNWISLTGDIAPIVADPDFADLGFEGTGTFSLYPGGISPMLQYGTPITGVPVDIDGNFRPGDFVSVGAHEQRGTYTYLGIQRILELIGGLSANAASTFCIGDAGDMESNNFLPEAALQDKAAIDNQIAVLPITDVVVSDGGLLTLSGEFIWRLLLSFAQASKCDLSEIHDGVIDEFTELGVYTSDGVMLFRVTFPHTPWDPLSVVTPVVKVKIRFEGKSAQQYFQSEVGYRCPNSDDLAREDWRTLRVAP